MSKYIDADRLKSEIKRLYDGEAPKHDQQCDFDDGYFTGIDVISQLIDSLQQEQPSLPNNLDEAAREIVIKMHPCLKDCTILGDRLTRGQLMALVKAGAKWMAEQGLKARKED